MTGAPEIDPPASPPPAIVEAGLKGLCPRCGAPTLFAGMIRFASRCRACGLDYDAFNVGDGPAALLTLVIGALVSIGAITLELTAHPPVWVHVLLWPPITIGLVIGALRVAKGMLIASEYRHRAREGRIVEDRAER
ncbi:DUF983 domain-containing protein [Sphingomonas oligoaromativorans]|uniref:DUF983 domain-containing protein n=1 Tax=Sphingomonas oligoaromativorans TaxID=575322 RepID=UPI001423590C|nr:DUF983 domain-containing protein [Sphingomonas oligoaromativorans]NIJ33078.1 uncharacterized protein (DUF983 family) [Sphingomonas oligoaromativorans]